MNEKQNLETSEMSVVEVDELATLQRVAEVMRLVQEDCEADAHKLDSTPFTPRGTGEQFGNIYAAIQAVARGVEKIAEQLQ